jgi:uncharacterized protein YlxW (UPF0749 family)
MKNLTAKNVKRLTETMCVCLLISTLCMCGLLLAARNGIAKMAAEAEYTRAVLLAQTEKATSSRQQLRETLISLQAEIDRVDAGMAAREKRMEAHERR